MESPDLGAIHIDMSGGGQIGAVNQGDGANATATVTMTKDGIRLEDVSASRQEIEALAEASDVSLAETRKVEAKPVELEERAKSGEAMKKIGATAKDLHDNLKWAAKPLGAFPGPLL